MKLLLEVNLYYIKIIIQCTHYTPALNSLPGTPDAKPVKRKTSIQGGGGLRKRWKDANGNIYEWDSQHGDL